MKEYLLFSDVMMFLLFLIWNRSNWINFFTKAVFFGLSVWGLILSLFAFGVIR